jgi:hypothetical protein
MTETNAGIYLIVQFNWPDKPSNDMAKKARALHDAVQGAGWVREAVAGYGGLGSGPSSIWVFWLENYAALEKLLRDKADPIQQVYVAFFAEMKDLNESLREEVLFL